MGCAGGSAPGRGGGRAGGRPVESGAVVERAAGSGAPWHAILTGTSPRLCSSPSFSCWLLRALQVLHGHFSAHAHKHTHALAELLPAPTLASARASGRGASSPARLLPGAPGSEFRAAQSVEGGRGQGGGWKDSVGSAHAHKRCVALRCSHTSAALPPRGRPREGAHPVVQHVPVRGRDRGRGPHSSIIITIRTHCGALDQCHSKPRRQRHSGGAHTYLVAQRVQLLALGFCFALALVSLPNKHRALPTSCSSGAQGGRCVLALGSPCGQAQGRTAPQELS